MTASIERPATAIRKSLSELRRHTNKTLRVAYNKAETIRFTGEGLQHPDIPVESTRIKGLINEAVQHIDQHTDTMEQYYQSVRQQIERLQATVDQQAQTIRDYERTIELSSLKR